MKNNFYKNSSFLQIIIIVSYFFCYSLFLECDKTYPILKDNECVSTYCTKEQFSTGECIINEPITKTKWLTNIIIFENTNGEINLFFNLDTNIIIFSTMFSNNEDRIYYGLMIELYDVEMKYFFNYNDNYYPYIIKHKIENKELINPEMCLNSEYIISIGNQNSSIELLNINNYMDDLIFISSNDCFAENTIVKGLTSFFFSNHNNFNYIAITHPKDDPSNHYLSFYNYDLDSSAQLSLNYYNNFNYIKNENVNCFLLDQYYDCISCLYLSKDNKYKINIITISKEDEKSFIVKNTTIIGTPSNINEDQLYFLKGIRIYDSVGIYCYYSGDSNEIPTFVVKTVSRTTYYLNDMYSEFPVFYLNDYSFNNDLKYNDLAPKSKSEVYFISTNKNREFLIIAIFNFYGKSSSNYLVIRYLTIKLQEFYNIKIFNSLKAVNLNSENYQNYLTLALDFCYYDSFQNSDNIMNNAGLIMFSNLNKTSDYIYIDFIEYAFNNNKNYIIVNFTENFKIENNIFGFDYNFIIIDKISFDNSIKFYDIKQERYKDMSIDEEREILYKESIIKINFTDYSLKNLEITYYLMISSPEDVNIFNEYLDKYNDTFGNIEDSRSYSQMSHTQMNSYYVEITQVLTEECNDLNCTLCLENDRDYCITCIDDNYSIAYNEEYKYGKLKTCNKNEIKEESTDISDILSDFQSSKSDEIDNKEESEDGSETFNNDDTSKNDENNNESSNIELNENTDEFTNKKEIESSMVEIKENTDTDEKEIESSNIQIKENTDEFTNEINIRSSNIELNYNTDELTNEKKIESSNIHIKENTDESTNEINNKSSNIQLNQNTDVLKSEINIKSSIIELKDNTDILTNEKEIKSSTIEIKDNTDVLTSEINIKSSTIEIKDNTDVLTSEIDIKSSNIEIKDNTDVLTSEINIKSSNIELKENSDVLTSEIDIKSSNIELDQNTDILTSEINIRTSIIKIKDNTDVLTSEINNETSNIELNQNTDILTNEINIKTSNIQLNLNTDEFTNEMDSILSDINSSDKNNLVNTDILTNDYKKVTDMASNNDNKKSNNNISFDDELLEDFLNGKYKNINLSDEEMKLFYEALKKYIYNNYDGNDKIINVGNVNAQISSIDSQKDSEEYSNVDLGECEKILKEKYCKTTNQSLVMLKLDIMPENETSTYVQYDIYEPNSKLFLELKECTGTNVVINVPIDLSSDIESLYDMLAKSGYNLFDANDSFYNDICAAFTTENNTDILLYDRRMDIYQLTINISLCQEGCNFNYYNSETKKAECDCPIQTEETNTNLSNIHFNKNEVVKGFYETLKNSNFRVLICYELVINFQVFLKNIGSIVMTILFLLFLLLMIIYIFVSSKEVNLYIQSIIKKKYLNKENEKSSNSSNKTIDIYNNIVSNTRTIHIKKDKNNKRKKSISISNHGLKVEEEKDINQEQNSKHISLLKQLRNKSKNKKKKNERRKSISSPPKKKTSNKSSLISNIGTLMKSRNDKSANNNLLSSNNYPLYLNDNNYICNSNIKNENDKNNNKDTSIHIFNKRTMKPKKLDEIEKKIFNKKSKRDKKNKTSKIISSTKEKDKNSNDELDKNKKETYIKQLNDQEMNSLDYNEALEYDKRTYFQYYISLLRKKHLIIFTFVPTNDYNLISLKISLFLVSFSLYLCINAFFFNDDTMHKIYKDSGVYNILYQIPQILYSSIISSVINSILKTLSLSEKDILKIKDEKDIKTTVTKSKNIEKCIKIKFVIFFIISLLLMLFFWYFISCFCAVYNNTQIILFKDTLISFTLSMLYPFGLNLLPGIFRIPSLRAEKKDKVCLYSFSKIIALI